MFTNVQTLAGATQFDGATVTTGLVDFQSATALPQLKGTNQIWIIDSVALRGDGATNMTTIECYLVEDVAETVPTKRLDIVELSNENGFSNIGCHIPVPQVEIIAGTINPTAGSWVLKLVTTGKSVDASFIVSFHIGERARQT